MEFCLRVNVWCQKILTSFISLTLFNHYYLLFMNILTTKEFFNSKLYSRVGNHILGILWRLPGTWTGLEFIKRSGHHFINPIHFYKHVFPHQSERERNITCAFMFSLLIWTGMIMRWNGWFSRVQVSSHFVKWFSWNARSLFLSYFVHHFQIRIMIMIMIALR